MPDKQDAISRVTTTIHGAVWALLANGLSSNDIHQIVYDAVQEYEPSEQPAFVLNAEESPSCD